MKKVGVIWVQDSINIGDDVQTVAIAELVQEIAPDAQIVYIDRESLSVADLSGLSHLIVSGWFLKRPDGFPTEFRGVKPLFISFHLTSTKSVPDEVLSDSRMSLWKSVGRVGCRDKGTLRKFQLVGVDAYFSACATLTLKPRPSQSASPYVLVVDPFYALGSDKYQRHQLRRLLGDEPEFEIREHENTDFRRPKKSMEARFLEANALLNIISDAQFVVTSRIHIALPALAMGTPVIFMHVGYDRNQSATDRFDGIIDLFHVVSADHFPFSSRKRVGKLLRWFGIYRYTASSIQHLIPETIKSGRGNKNESVGFEYAKDIRQVVEQYLR